MAGKTPLLLAVVLFAIGASGLALTSADRASWGPFEPRTAPERTPRIIVIDVGTPFAVPALENLLMGVPETATSAEPPQLAYAPEPSQAPEPIATPTPIPPLRVFGISSDDGGVFAAAVTPTPLTPLRVANVASGDDSSEPAETPEAEAVETETPEASGTAETGQ